MRRKALSSPADCARLRMLVYCLKVHRVRFVACMNALKSTHSVLLSIPYCATLFDRISHPTTSIQEIMGHS